MCRTALEIAFSVRIWHFFLGAISRSGPEPGDGHVGVWGPVLEQDVVAHKSMCFILEYCHAVINL